MADTTQANRYEDGLRNLYIAPIGADGKYEAPVRVIGAISIKGSAKESLNDIYADDGIYDEITQNEGVFELKITHYHPTDPALNVKILGHTLDPHGNEGKKSGVTKQAFALIFEKQGSADPCRVVLYKGVASEPDINADTQADKTDPDKIEIDAKFSPMDFADGSKWSFSKVYKSIDATSYESMFTTVYDPTAAKA
jgi:phi13 family phage major tail protein